jgi:hypothetical protein
MMAPMMGPSRKQLIALLQKPKPQLPITLGEYSPQATVENAGGRWRIVELEEDREASRRAGEQALARGHNWMPENTWAFLRPGKVVVDVASKEELIAKVEKMKWSWGDGPRG